MTPAEHLRTIREHVEQLVCPRRNREEGSLEILALPDTTWHCAWYGGKLDDAGNVSGGALGWTRHRPARADDLPEPEPITTDRACWIMEDPGFDAAQSRRWLHRKGWFWRKHHWSGDKHVEEEWLLPGYQNRPMIRCTLEAALLSETQLAFDRYLAPRRQAAKHKEMEAHAKAVGADPKVLDRQEHL